MKKPPIKKIYAAIDAIIDLEQYFEGLPSELKKALEKLRSIQAEHY